jgi:hypothetical protein
MLEAVRVVKQTLEASDNAHCSRCLLLRGEKARGNTALLLLINPSS